MEDNYGNLSIDMTIETFVELVENEFEEQENLDDVYLTGFDETLGVLIPFESISRSDVKGGGKTFQTVNLRTNLFRSLFVHNDHLQENPLSEKDSAQLKAMHKSITDVIKFEDDVLESFFKGYFLKNIDLILAENERLSLIRRMKKGNL